MQNDPDQATEPMGDGGDGLIVSQARHQSAIDDLENGSFRLDRGVGSLIENAPHVAVTLRGAVALGYFRALFVSGACSYPGRELLAGRKCRCGSTHLGDDLLRRIHTQAGYFREPLDHLLMLAEQSRHLLVQLADLLLDQLQLLQEHLEQSAVDGLELRAGGQGVA